MKKFYLFLLGSILSSQLVTAQITITQADFASVGDTVYMGRDTTVSASAAGSAGASQTWDFSSFHTQVFDTLPFLNPATLSHGGSYPSANLSFRQLGIDGYVNKSANGVEIIAIGGELEGSGIDISAPYVPTETYIQFPATFNSTYSDTMGFRVTVNGTDAPILAQYSIDTIIIIRNSTSVSTVDAWGTVSTPIMGATSCIRQKIIGYTEDSIRVNADTSSLIFSFPGLVTGYDSVTHWGYLTPVAAALLGPSLGFTVHLGAIDTTTTYRFYGAGKKYFIAEIGENQDGLTHYAYFQSDQTQLGVDEQAVNNFRIYPNPTNSDLNITTEFNQEAELMIYDITGNHVKTIALKAEKTSAKVTDLADGLYIYKVIDMKSNAVLSSGRLNKVAR